MSKYAIVKSAKQMADSLAKHSGKHPGHFVGKEEAQQFESILKSAREEWSENQLLQNIPVITGKTRRDAAATIAEQLATITQSLWDEDPENMPPTGFIG